MRRTSRLAAKVLLPLSLMQVIVLPLAGCYADRGVGPEKAVEDPPELRGERITVVRARGRLAVTKLKEPIGRSDPLGGQEEIRHAARGAGSPDVQLVPVKALLVEEGALPPEEGDDPIEDYPIAVYSKSLPNLSVAINQQNVDTTTGAILTATAPATANGQPNIDITFAENGQVTSKVQRTWQSVSNLWVIDEETTTLYDAAGDAWVRLHFVADEVWVEELGIPQLAEIGYRAEFAKLCVGEFLQMVGAGLGSALTCAASGPVWWLNPYCISALLVFIGTVDIFLRCVKGG